MKKKVTLGTEYDDVVRAALKQVLVALHAASGGQRWAMGGSQEIETMEVLVGEQQLTVESETYVGLTISGEEDLVDSVAALVRAKVGPSSE